MLDQNVDEKHVRTKARLWIEATRSAGADPLLIHFEGRRMIHMPIDTGAPWPPEECVEEIIDLLESEPVADS